MRFLAAALVAACSFPAAGCAKPGPEREVSGAAAGRPNVILVSIDTLRARNLGCYGYERPTSPTIDALAKEGVVFETAYSQSPKTGPSHMTMMTGLHPGVHQVTNWGSAVPRSLSPAIPTLAEILKANGYATFASTAGGNVKPDLGFGKGFDAYTVRSGDVDRNVKVAIRQVESHLDSNGDSPFFLFLHTYQVHDPYLPPSKCKKRFASDPEYAGRIVDSAGDLERIGTSPDDQHAAYWSRVNRDDPADVRRLVDLYDACISATDSAFEHLIDRLRKRGAYDDTIIVVTSDHGEEFLEHGQFLHNSIYREVVHVPLIVKLPGGAHAGRRVGGIARLVDLTPTLLDLLSIPTRATFQGESLFRSGAPVEAPREAFCEWTTRGEVSLFQYSIRTLEWTYMLFGDEPGALFAASEKTERVNLLETNREIASRFEKRIRRLQVDGEAFASALPAGDEIELGKETRAQLEQLGYLK